MRVAYLILAHQLNDQLRLLLDTLTSDDRSSVYLHMDKKCKDLGWLKEYDHRTLTMVKRRKVNWAGYSMVDATINLLKSAVEEHTNSKFLLLSATCFPVKPMSEVNDTVLGASGAKMAVWGKINNSDPSLEGLGGGTVNKFFFNDVPIWNPSKGKLYHRLWSIYKKANQALPYRRALKHSEIWKGSQFFLMDRPLAQACCNLPRTLVHDLKYALAPDELAFVTSYVEYRCSLGLSIETIDPEATIQNLHYIRKRVPERGNMSLRDRLVTMVDLRRLNEHDIADAVSSSALFTRKCTMEVADALKDIQLKK